ncbi:MAG: polysaccharide deacetylase family protein [Deltaproteobacteria bacterium]|nr:polysaccharide deacetylase family protein [Deltaproteobacteria bacterium]
MKTSILFKKIFSSVLFKSGSVDNKISQLCAQDLTLILMYHRVVPADQLVQAGMYVSPATFESHLIFLAKYFNVVPLNSLTVKKNRAGIRGKPSCVLTFDDGWQDFYEYAYPLLVKYQLPATVFLPTEFIGTGKQFWTDCFAGLLSHRQATIPEKLSCPDILPVVAYLDGLQGSFAKRLEAGIEYLKKYPLSKIEKVLAGLSEIWQVDLAGSGRNFLNWAEIAEMKDSGLISFGSHTVNHQILTTLDNTAIKNELIASRKELLQRNVVDSSCVSFCYPNGNHTKEIAAMVRSAGYHLAVTTRKGWNRADADKFTLKRIGIHEDMTSTPALFACRIAGLI